MAKSIADYFSHDTDASFDEKIIYLESLFGDSGYAWFFKMLEALGRSQNFEIEWSELKCGVLARKFNTTQQEFNNFIVAATKPEVRAFVIENGKLYSPGLKKRLEKMLDRRKKEAERIAEKRVKTGVDATSVDVAATSTQSKVKESKVKESKVREEKNAHAKKADSGTKNAAQNTPQISAAPPGAQPDIDSEINEMLVDDLCVERFFRQCQIPVDQYAGYCETFRLKLKSEKATHSNRRDFRSHFFSWASLEFARNQKLQNGGTRLEFHSQKTISEGIAFAERFAKMREAGKI